MWLTSPMDATQTLTNALEPGQHVEILNADGDVAHAGVVDKLFTNGRTLTVSGQIYTLGHPQMYFSVRVVR